LADQQAKITADFFKEKEKENWKKNLTKLNTELIFQPKTKAKGGPPKVSDERISEF